MKQDTAFRIQQGRLEPAEWLPSPNYNKRPDGMDIDTIVIHNISLPPKQFSQKNAQNLHYVKAFFTNQLDWQAHDYFKSIEGMQVSAHLFVERDGSVTQFVNFNDRAWHAGQSCYLGRDACNDFSIGIELEGADDIPFTNEQYQTLSLVIMAIYQAYPKTRRHITGHSDIAPNRKTDPGVCFDWQRLRQSLANLEPVFKQN